MFVIDYGSGIETVQARNRRERANPGQWIEKDGVIAGTGGYDIAANNDLRFVICKTLLIPGPAWPVAACLVQIDA